MDLSLVGAANDYKGMGHSWQSAFMKIFLIIFGIFFLSACSPQDGAHEAYYENGQIQTRANYKDGREDGLYESYYENGQLRVKIAFKDGKRDGLAEWYYENGQIRSRQNFREGKRDGLWEFFEADGRLLWSRNSYVDEGLIDPSSVIN